MLFKLFYLIYKLFLDISLISKSSLLFYLFIFISFPLILLSYFKLLFQISLSYFNLSSFINKYNSNIINPILLLSSCQLSKKIKDKNDQLTSEILLDMFISHINKVNPLINSIVGTRYNQARIEAKNIDKLVKEDKIPNNCSLFWGVPILVKECFEIENMPFTGGLIGRKGIVGSCTGPVIQKVQEAGAIVFASTNTSEACMYHESINHVYGCTNNPYDLRRSAGGSSGGCGAAVSACCAPFAVTSDVGGSTRIPALYNCLFGHKPTGGAISNKNTFPTVGESGIKRFCQLGPTCRHSEDLWPLFQTMLSRETLLVDEDIVIIIIIIIIFYSHFINSLFFIK